MLEDSKLSSKAPDFYNNNNLSQLVTPTEVSDQIQQVRNGESILYDVDEVLFAQDAYEFRLREVLGAEGLSQGAIDCYIADKVSEYKDSDELLRLIDKTEREMLNPPEFVLENDAYESYVMPIAYSIEALQYRLDQLVKDES